MAVSQRRIRRDIQSNLPLVGGGAVGVGGPATLREFADIQDGQPFSLIGDPGTTVGRLTRPSVAYGLGAGALTGVLYLGGLGPGALEDFYLAHTLTALPAGAASAALPKEAQNGGGGGGGGNTQAASQRMVRERRQVRADGQGEFGPSGGQSADTRDAR